MKKTLTLLFLLLSVFGHSQKPLSSSAEISILTIAPGESLNDTWGHSAIRVKDIDFDIVFNYGTYDFNTPNFYTKFMRGKLLFDLGINQYDSFLFHYSYQNREVKEQVLHLTNKEKQAYFDFLTNNAKPANRKYLYDFFFDNCATKLREVNTDILKKNVIYKDNFFRENTTFRDLIYQKLDTHPWGKFGIDIALGSVIDRNASPEEFSFLPSYTFETFKTASVMREGKSMPLIKETKILYKQKDTLKSVSFFSKIFSPVLVFSAIALLVLIITYFDFKRKRQTKIVDFLLLFCTGLVGLLVFLLWFATDHSATKDNFNIFWAFLPNLVVAFYVYKPQKYKLLKKYYTLLIFLIVLLLLFWIITIQVFNIALLPILLMLSIRYYYNINRIVTKQ